MHHVTVIQGHIPPGLMECNVLCCHGNNSPSLHPHLGLLALTGRQDSQRSSWWGLTRCWEWNMSIGSFDSSCRLLVTAVADRVMLSPFTWPAGQGQKAWLQRSEAEARIFFFLSALTFVAKLSYFLFCGHVFWHPLSPVFTSTSWVQPHRLNSHVFFHLIHFTY